MRILLTGGSGLLGSKIARLISEEGFECVHLNREYLRMEPVSAERNKYLELFEGCQYLIHAAANTNVENCEIDVESCYNDNVILSGKLKDAAKIKKIPMLYISSTGIYGDYQKGRPWEESDPCWPTTRHHQSKYIAERLVLDEETDNLVVRTGWLFGSQGSGKVDFVVARLKEMMSVKDKIMYSNKSQFGNPTYTKDLAARILLLIKNREKGVFNIVNECAASRYDYVKEIANIAKIDLTLIAVEKQMLKRQAAVSDNEMASNKKMYAKGYTRMRPWRNALQEHIETLYHHKEVT